MDDDDANHPHHHHDCLHRTKWAYYDKDQVKKESVKPVVVVREIVVDAGTVVGPAAVAAAVAACV